MGTVQAGTNSKRVSFATIAALYYGNKLILQTNCLPFRSFYSKDVTNDYPSDKEAVGDDPRHKPEEPMRPFYGKRNKDGISDIYTKYHYKFADLPVCSKNSPSCGSRYLFCHKEKELCLPRIKPGGSCEGLHIYKPCYESDCHSNICSEKNS